MESEKVKEIKKVLEFQRDSLAYLKDNVVEYVSCKDILTYINELESENERLSKEKEDLRLFDIALGNGKVDMTLGGNTAKSFINAIVQIFEQNNATNFLATTIESISSGNKYSLVIQKENGQTPSEKLSELKDRIAELEKQNARLLDSVETVQSNRCVYKCVLTKEHLTKFAEMLKAKMPCEEVFKGVWDKIDETLKEFIK